MKEHLGREKIYMDEIIGTEGKTVYPIIFPVNYSNMGSINCYIYQNGNEYTLIDAGIKGEEFEQFFYRKLSDYSIEIKKINRIILTHFHEDHTGLVNKLAKDYSIPVYASQIAITRLKCEGDYLQKKLTFYQELYNQYGVMEYAIERLAKMENTLHNKEKVILLPTIKRLEEGQQIGGLQIIAVPGHSPDSIGFWDKENGWLFAGDFLLASGMTNALIDHDEAGEVIKPLMQYIESIKKVKSFSIQYVFAGHEAVFQNLDEVIEKSLSKMEYKLQKLVKKIREGHHSARAIGEAIYGPRFAKHFIFIISEIIGLTLLAQERGIVERHWQDGQWIFQLKES